MANSLIQQAADEIFEAAEIEMDEVIRLEAEHGRCYNFYRLSEDDIWVFEDGYKHHITRKK